MKAFRFCAMRSALWAMLIILVIILGYSQIALSAISPSQVLVLYNSDWKSDEFLTDPGQDSKEIADHYVRMHTDSKTGEKPYVIGLSCTHLTKHLGSSHLNSEHLIENSSDNGKGVVFSSKNPLKSKSNKDMRDSRTLEFNLPKIKNAEWQFDTLKIVLIQKGKEAAILVEKGKSYHKARVRVFKTGKWNVRTNGRALLKGSFLAKASCMDSSGKKHRWEAEYSDIADISFSKTGPDGKQDDQHYLKDIENQVKKYLEDPKNARSDGTLLKDHIMFIVVCYGLPRTTVAPYGIARGITESMGNYGAIISLEQRLQLMYYNVDAVMGTLPQPQHFNSKSPFSAYYFRTPQAKPLYGEKANPFVHPQLYHKKISDLDELKEPLLFSSDMRRSYKNQHLYFVMRVDSKTAMQAKSLIDRAVYASKYSSPKMGIIDKKANDKSDRVGNLNRSKVEKWLRKMGYCNLTYVKGKNLLAYGWLTKDSGFFNKEPVYLPGGIGSHVKSNNGWKNGEMTRDLHRGVTVTAGSGGVVQGAPHIHNHSWWDDKIVYPFLLKGKTMGEILLMNQIHLGWITTFVGDPLYSLPEKTIIDKTPPEFDKQKDINYIIKKNGSRKKELWLRVDLKNALDEPETAQLMAVSEKGEKKICSTFEAKPYVNLGKYKKASKSVWNLKLIDPYGNIATAETRYSK